jgi:hypothetical protein
MAHALVMWASVWWDGEQGQRTNQMLPSTLFPKVAIWAGLGGKRNEG